MRCKYENTQKLFSDTNSITCNDLKLSNGGTYTVTEDIDIGYTNYALIKMNIGLFTGRSDEDFKFNNLIYATVKENYTDSDGNTAYRRKIINLGAYIKSGVINVVHVTETRLAELQSIEIIIVNKSGVSIDVNDIGLYKEINSYGSSEGTGLITRIEVRDTLPDEADLVAGRIFYLR